MSLGRCNRAAWIELSPGKKDTAIMLLSEELAELCEEVTVEVADMVKHEGRKWVKAHLKVVVDLEDIS